MIPAGIVSCLALVWLALFPPGSTQAASWLGPALLGLACFASQRRHRLFRGGDALGILMGFGWVLCLIVHGLEAFSVLPMALLVLLSFSLGQRTGDEPSRQMLVCAAGATILIEIAIAGTQRWMGMADPSANASIAARLSQHRVWGSFLTPNILAAWLLIMMPLLISEFLGTRQIIFKFFCGLSLILGSILFWWTGSAGGTLALLGALSLFLWIGWQKIPSGKRLVLATLLMGVAAVLGMIFLTRGFTFFQKGSGQDFYYNRLQLWIPGLTAMAKAPIFGVGPALAQSAYRDAQVDSASGFGAFPHQAILSLGIGYGICGILLAFLWLGFYVAQLRRWLQRDGSLWRIGAAFSVACALIQSQWEMSLQQPVILLTVAFIAGLALAPITPDAPDGAAEAEFSLAGSFRLWHAFLVVTILLLFRGGLMPWQWPACVGLLMLVLMIKGEIRISPFGDPASLGVVLALFWMLAASLNGLEPGKGISEMLALTCGFLCWALLRCETLEKPRRNVEIWVGTACLFAALVFVRGWGPGTSLPGGGIWKMGFPLAAAHFFYPNQNLLAGGVIVPALLFCLAEAWQGQRKLLAILAAGWLAFFLAYCGSRGASLALIAGIMWMGLRFVKSSGLKSAWRIVGAFVGVIIVFSGIMMIPNSTLAMRIQHQQDPGTADPYDSFRTQIWRESFALIKQRPIQGWGLASFGEAIQTRDLPTPFVGPYTIARYRLIAEHAHNEWLELGVENGLPALAIFMALVFIGFLRLYRRPFSSPGQIALEAGVFAIVAQSLVDFNLHCPSILALLVLMLAYLFPRVEARWLHPLEKLAIAALFSMALSVALQGWLAQGRKLPSDDLQMALNPLSPDVVMGQAANALDGAQAGSGAKLGKAMRLASLASAMAPDSSRIQAKAALLCHQAAKDCPEPRLEVLGQLWPDWIWIGSQDPHASAVLKMQRLSQNLMDRAMELHPFDARLHLSAAYMALDSGDYARVNGNLSQAIAIEPNFAGAWELRAKLALQSKNHDGLAQALNRLKEIEKIPIEAEDSASAQMKYADWGWIDHIEEVKNRSFSGLRSGS